MTDGVMFVVSCLVFYYSHFITAGVGTLLPLSFLYETFQVSFCLFLFICPPTPDFYHFSTFALFPSFTWLYAMLCLFLRLSVSVLVLPLFVLFMFFPSFVLLVSVWMTTVLLLQLAALLVFIDSYP